MSISVNEAERLPQADGQPAPIAIVAEESMLLHHLLLTMVEVMVVGATLVVLPHIVLLSIRLANIVGGLAIVVVAMEKDTSSTAMVDMKTVALVVMALDAAASVEAQEDYSKQQYQT